MRRPTGRLSVYGALYASRTYSERNNSQIQQSNSTCPSVAARLQKWALTLSAYNYEIKYRTGANNGNANALSRKPLVQNNLDAEADDTTNNVLAIETVPFNVSNDEMVRETRKDRILSVVYDCLLKGRELPQSAEFWPCARVEDPIHDQKKNVNILKQKMDVLFLIRFLTPYCPHTFNQNFDQNSLCLKCLIRMLPLP